MLTRFRHTFKIVTDIQIRGDLQNYKERIRLKNKRLAIITVLVLLVSLALAVYAFFYLSER